MTTDLDNELESAVSERIKESGPKRGRGRPPKDGNVNTGSTKRDISVKSTVDNLKILLNAGNNIFFTSVKPQLQMLMLTPQEINALGEGIEAELKANAKLRNLIAGAGRVSPHIVLAQAVGTIAISKFMIYQQMKIMQTAHAVYGNGNSNGNGFSNVVENPVPVGSGTASDDSGGNGQRENDARLSYFSE